MGEALVHCRILPGTRRRGDDLGHGGSDERVKRGVEMIFSGDQNADLDRTDRQGQDE